MSMNHIGKFLVLLHTTASLLALGGAAAIFLQFTDWGWKDPRKDLEFRVASEYDKRAAAAKEALVGRDMILPKALPTQAALREAQHRLGDNHLVYVDDLKKLREGAGDPDAKEFKTKDGKTEIDSKGRPTGKPVMADKVPGISKSFKDYLDEYQSKMDEVDKLAKEVTVETERVQSITFRLTGRDDTGKPAKIGLYDLLNEEKEAQDRATDEMDYLRPKWATSVGHAELHRSRAINLQRTLDRLKKKE